MAQPDRSGNRRETKGEGGEIPAPLLALSGIVKRFPDCLANDKVDLDIREGEIHALLGENGAGKSTLVKIIYGLLTPESGDIFWQGKKLSISGPAHARALGIGMVFQHFSLFESLTVRENIALSLSSAQERWHLSQELAAISREYGLDVDAGRVIHDLSVGERQRVEILRALLQKPRLLIMDEPTSVLTPQETERLFGILRRLADQGCAILYISHKLEEIRILCGRATIMRAGRVIATCDPGRETARRLAELMIGTELQALRSPKREQPDIRQPAHPLPLRLSVQELSMKSARQFGIDLKSISFDVRGGEIFGIAGIAGNGQKELMDALSGEAIPLRKDSICIDGKAIGNLSPRERRMLGACFVPEERGGHAAISGMTLTENAFLSSYDRRSLLAYGFIKAERSGSFADSIIQAFSVKARNRESEARSLSGGNLQKFIVGREILQSPDILIVSQPTWGVDAGAASFIHQALLDLAEQGAAIVVISQDLDEIFAICDRIAVIAAGQLSDSMRVKDAKIDEVGLLMGGIVAKKREAQSVA